MHGHESKPVFVLKALKPAPGPFRQPFAVANMERKHTHRLIASSVQRRIYRRSRSRDSHHATLWSVFTGVVGAASMMAQPPRAQVDLVVTTKELRLRVERVLANLEPITQQRDPILADPRAVWLDITLSIHELESAASLMKRAWWP
jgi:hypothetical protein